MRKSLCIGLLICIKLNVSAQLPRKIGDSVTVIFKNTSAKEFVRYMAAINGQTIFGLNLKSGQSRQYRIAVDGNNIYRFTLYTSLDPDERYSIEPMDYPSQVSKMLLVKGTYLYTVTIDRHNELNVSLQHLKN